MSLLWKDPAGAWHRVTVIMQSHRSSTVEYFDNTRRGICMKAGRKYNHATRVRVVVWNTELREVQS